jgi:hypothetical protein
MALGFCVVSCAHHDTTSPFARPDRGIPVFHSNCSMDIEKAARMSLDALGGESECFHAMGSFDLNDDGYLDVVIVQDDCTVGSCRMLVLGGTEDGLELISAQNLTAHRIFASRHTTNGWRDLIVHAVNVSGTGYSVFRFDGLGYVEDTTGGQASSETMIQAEKGIFLLETPGRDRQGDHPAS